MAFCTHCGGEYPGSRFCTNCGADQLSHDATSDRTGRPRTEDTVLTNGVNPPVGVTSAAPHRSASRRQLFIGAAAGVTVLALAAAAVFVFAGRGEVTAGGTPTATPTSGDTETLTRSAQSAPSPAGGQAGQTAVTLGGTVAGSLAVAPAAGSTTGAGRLVPRTVSASSTAPASADDQGVPITYDAPNTADNNPATAWRAVEGDGVGQELILTLSPGTRVTSVGLIPGYDKIDTKTGTDRFSQNRRISKVSWTFDDGKVIEQSFIDDRSLQSVTVAATTTTVRLRILASTPSANTTDPRNFVAISEIGIVGST